MWEEGLCHTLFRDAMLSSVGVSVGYVGTSVSVLIKITIPMVTWFLGVEETRLLIRSGFSCS